MRHKISIERAAGRAQSIWLGRIRRVAGNPITAKLAGRFVAGTRFELEMAGRLASGGRIELNNFQSKDDC